MKYVLTFFVYVLISLSVIHAENLIRLRGMQPSSLLFNSAEQGVIKSGSNETDLKTNIGESQNLLYSIA